MKKLIMRGRFSGFAFAILLLPMTAFFSCSSQISGTLRENGTADFHFNTGLETRMSGLIRSFQSMMGEAANSELILDAQAISLSMSTAPGMGRISMSNTGPASLEGMVILNRVDDFLAIAGTERRFVTFTGNSGSPGHGSVVISLDRETAPNVIALLSAEVSAYLSALMAPAATGERLTIDEYLFLTGAFYGAPIAEEIKQARLRVSLELPGRITSIVGGTASGRRAEFDIPLVDLLVLETPLRWEINWTR